MGASKRLAEQDKEWGHSNRPGFLTRLKNRVRSALERQERSGDPLAGAAVADAEVELELLRRKRERKGGE